MPHSGKVTIISKSNERQDAGFGAEVTSTSSQDDRPEEDTEVGSDFRD